MKAIRVLLVVIAAIAIGSYLGRFAWGGVDYRAFVPNIVLSAESLGPPWLTNTLFSTLVVDAIILMLALLARRGIRQDGNLPGNKTARAWEALIDGLYRDYVYPTLGKRAKAVVPVAVAGFVFILASAMLVLIPGVESIGRLNVSPTGSKGWCVAQAGGVMLITGVPVDEKHGYRESCGRPAPSAANTQAAQSGYSITPFLRRPTSDMNVALALALVAFFFVEIQGLRANGWHYFKRFFPIQDLELGRADMMDGTAGLTGVLHGLAGLLALIVELLRIVSFSFRLFGAMFVGSVLVLVVGAILPVLLPTVFLGLEVAAGVVQAGVFLMLITAFTSLAVSHEEP